MLRTCSSLVRPEWRALDLLGHTESTIHRIVRLREPDATPPELACERVSTDEAVIRYGSPRCLCALARDFGADRPNPRPAEVGGLEARRPILQ